MNVYFATAVAAALAIGIVARLTGSGWTRALGIGLVAWPFARLAVNIGANAGRLLTFTVLEPIPAHVLWESAGRMMWHNVAIPLVGLALILGLPEALRFSRLTPRLTWTRDGLTGLALLPAVIGGYIVALLVVTSGFADRLVNGDESRVFAEVTLLLAVVVSVAAGVSEEFLYRGVLLSLLGRFAPLSVAVGLQAIVFGFAHAGYGTWAHVVGPLIFGLFMGILTIRVGLLPAVILHAGIDVVFFAFEIGNRAPEVWWLVGLLAIAAGVSLALVRLEPARAILRLRG